MIRVYLCGAIDRASDSGIGWRTELTAKLTAKRSVITVLDPTQKASQTLADEARAALATGDTARARACMMKIRADDLRMLLDCDYVLAYIDPTASPCGSYFELAIAAVLHKPVYLVIAGGVRCCPMWLLTEALEVHDDFDDFDVLVG